MLTSCLYSSLIIACSFVSYRDGVAIGATTIILALVASMGGVSSLILFGFYFPGTDLLMRFDLSLFSE